MRLTWPTPIAPTLLLFVANSYHCNHFSFYLTTRFIIENQPYYNQTYQASARIHRSNDTNPPSRKIDLSILVLCEEEVILSVAQQCKRTRANQSQLIEGLGVGRGS